VTVGILASAGLLAAKDWNLSVDSNGDAIHCSDLRVKSGGQVSQSTEAFSVSSTLLELAATDRGSVKVVGADRGDFGVEVCKIAVSDNQFEADQLVRNIVVNRSAGRLTTTGPEANTGSWQVYYLVQAPRYGNVDLETRNGPVSIKDVSGNIKVRATNGPLSVQNCGGTVDAETVNGPVSFSGNGGDVHINTHNGPLSVKLSGDYWNGTKLEASTINGPLSLNVPETFRSGVRLETDGHSPMSCKLDACRNVTMDATGSQRVIQLNGSGESVHITTHNGPVSIGSSDSHKVI